MAIWGNRSENAVSTSSSRSKADQKTIDKTSPSHESEKKSSMPSQKASNSQRSSSIKVKQKARKNSAEDSQVCNSAEMLNDKKYRTLIYRAYPNEATCSCPLMIGSPGFPKCRSGCNRDGCTSRAEPLHKGCMRDDNTDSTRLCGGADDGKCQRSCCSQKTSRTISESVTMPEIERSKPACSKPCVGIDCLLRAFEDAQDFVDSLGKVPGLAGLGLMDPSESPFFGREQRAPPRAFGDLFAEKSTAMGAPGTSGSKYSPMDTGSVGVPGTTDENMSFPVASLTMAPPGRTGVVREAVPVMPDTISIPGAMQSLASGKWQRKREERREGGDKQKEGVTQSNIGQDGDQGPAGSAPGVATTAAANESGPCGDPKCLSRKDKPTSLMDSVEAAVESTDETGRPRSGSDRATTKSRGGRLSSDKKKRRKASINASGDRTTAGSKAAGPVKISKQVMKYVYNIGDAYPGINYGHRNCIEPRLRVPANMGWLWNTRAQYGKLKSRIGWRPGAISKYLNEILKEAKKAGSSNEDARPRSAPSRGKKGKLYKTMSYTSVKKSQLKETEEEIEPPPTLHIHRKDGTYYVTMYPIKQESMSVPRLQEPMKPLQFKIARSKVDTASVDSSSTGSDMEIEFSPPAAVGRHIKKPDVVHVDTQVRQHEIQAALKPTADDLKARGKKPKKDKKLKK